MYSAKKYGLMILCGCLLVAACRKRPDPVPPVADPVIPGNPAAPAGGKSAPELVLQFQNAMDGKPLKLKEYYRNAHGDSFYVNTYKYYISNISLMDENGNEYREKESYHLIDQQKKESQEIVLKDIPAGSWTKIRFLIGVDSVKNVSGAQTGALDPMHGMFWDWNTGYVMAAFEGSSPQAGPFPNNLAFHLGGFSSFNSVLRWVELPLAQALTTDSNRVPKIFIQSEVGEWFKTPTTIDFSELPFLSSLGLKASMIADNYADMFSVAKTEE